MKAEGWRRWTRPVLLSIDNAQPQINLYLIGEKL